MNSSNSSAERVTLITLHNIEWDVNNSLPIDLGHGVRVVNTRNRFIKRSLHIWREILSKEQRENIASWSVCFEHRYSADGHNDAEHRESERLLRYVLAHLRFLAPEKTNGNYLVQGEIRRNRVYVMHASIPMAPVFLVDCEVLAGGITLNDFAKLRGWMPWIVDFYQNWKTFLPLYISMELSERSYTEPDARIRHLERVMALEALFTIGRKVFGLNALKRIPKLIGASVDIYEQYNSDMQHLPELRCTPELLRDMYKLRNLIAHGRRVPKGWLKRNKRHGSYGVLSHSEQLIEAATGVLALCWKAIVNQQLQATFANKRSLNSFLAGKRPAKP